MKKTIKKGLILSIGVIFIILGLFGLVLPILQGVIFLIIGFLLISLYFPKIRAHLTKHAEKSPRVFSIINKVEKWIAKFVGEI